MSVIASKTAVAEASFVTLYSAEMDGTINIRIVNASESETVVDLYVTDMPSAPLTSDGIERGVILVPGGSLLEMGEPIQKGESVVVKASGSSVNLAARVSGFTE